MGARPAEHKKGADQGIDGRLIFSDGSERQEIILSVKAGHVTSAHVDQLRGVVTVTVGGTKLVAVRINSPQGSPDEVVARSSPAA